MSTDRNTMDAWSGRVDPEPDSPRWHQVIGAFAQNGYAPAATGKQFFLPMVLHRMLKSRPASAALEAVCRALGLTRLWGSPVIVRFEPRG